MRWWLAAVAIAIVWTGAGVRAADLEVTITNLRNADGVVRLALYDKAEGFATADAVIEAQVVAAADDPVRAVFEGLAPGTYAIAAYHNEDNDDKFDTFFGIPREGYAFSNDARPRLRAPTFEEGAFEVPAAGTAITFAMGY